MDERLTLISTMVQPCETVADVGCDHGYLICALVRQGKCRRGIAADINPMPLEKARQEVASQGLQQQVRCVCTDGLQGIGRQDAVIVAGMGGELIAEILEQWEYRTDPHVRYYLQPMTKAERLRAWLYENGCRILREQCCIAAGRPYAVLEAVYTGEQLAYTPADLYLGAVQPTQDPAARAYCTQVRNRAARKLAGLTQGGEAPQTLQYWQALLKELDMRQVRPELRFAGFYELI